MPAASLILLILLAVLHPAAAQTVYRCLGPDGKVEFRQRPCTPGEQGGAVQLQNLNTVGALRLSPEQARTLQARSAIGRGVIVAGMTAAEVHEVLGLPVAVNRTAATWGTREQLVYRHADGSTRYVYLRDGLVDAVSDYSGPGRRPGQGGPCYTEHEIRNASVGMHSNVLPAEERARRAEQVRQMRACRR